FDTCSCQTARCFNKSKGVLITGLKLKAFRNPQPSWGFSVHKKMPGCEKQPGIIVNSLLPDVAKTPYPPTNA
ncbi:hypothetical protein, partial [Escherichia coli]